MYANADLQCIKVNPAWSKGYARKGAALHGQRRYDEAIAAYEEGLKLEDNPALRKGLQEVKDAKGTHPSTPPPPICPPSTDSLVYTIAADERGDGAEAFGLSKLFADPNLLGKLATNPRTQKHLADPSFVQKIQLIQKNPSLAESMLSGDPRLIDVLGVLMGIDIQGFTREEGSNDLPEGLRKAEPEPTPQPSASTSTSTPPPAPEQKEEDVEMEDDEEAKVKKEALEEKAKGANAYKAKDFPTAAAHFEKAWDLWPNDITFLTNLGGELKLTILTVFLPCGLVLISTFSAVYFEQGDYDKCIETCEKAVDEGRSVGLLSSILTVCLTDNNQLRADYKLIAKALGRIGNAYHKKGDLDEAIKYFNKSLTEHRTADILNKLHEAEREAAEKARLAYIDPAKADAAREEGNALFKAGDFAGAVKAYTEAIKRNPDDPRSYNNRANAYTKLAAFPEALKDAEAAIKVDPKFIKAYIRKSHVLFAMRDYTKSLEVMQEAADADEEKKHTKEIADQVLKCQQALMQQRAGETEEETLQRAMRDPEIAVSNAYNCIRRRDVTLTPDL